MRIPNTSALLATSSCFSRSRRKINPQLIILIPKHRDYIPVATGTVVLRKETGTACIIEIVSDESYRGKGYGARIFAKCVEAAVSKGFKRLVLTASEDGKPVYARQGFKLVDAGPVQMLDLAT
jgi:GNAT superfamily N-acetyltransferase